MLSREGKKAHRLTHDHKASDESEIARIQAAGGFVVMNRVNGMLINKQMNHAQGALQALRPQTAAANHFYGPGGLSTSLPRSRGFLAG